MAGDWIPCELTLFGKREVLAISRQTRRSRHEVGGLLLAFWGWFSTESSTGLVGDIGLESLVDIVGADVKFWRAVVAQGWILDHGEQGIEVPNADRWITRGAKARLQKNRRQATWRGGDVDASPSTTASTRLPTTASHVDAATSTEPSLKASTTVQYSTEEKRREEKEDGAPGRANNPACAPTHAVVKGDPMQKRQAEADRSLAISLVAAHPYLGLILDPALVVSQIAAAHPNLPLAGTVRRAIAYLTPEQLAEQEQQRRRPDKFLCRWFDNADQPARANGDGGAFSAEKIAERTQAANAYQERQERARLARERKAQRYRERAEEL